MNASLAGLKVWSRETCVSPRLLLPWLRKYQGWEELPEWTSQSSGYAEESPSIPQHNTPGTQRHLQLSPSYKDHLHFFFIVGLLVIAVCTKQGWTPRTNRIQLVQPTLRMKAVHSFSWHCFFFWYMIPTPCLARLWWMRTGYPQRLPWFLKQVQPLFQKTKQTNKFLPAKSWDFF